MRIESVLLDVVEGGRFLEGLPQTGPVFYMTAVTANSRVKDILQRVLPEEQVAYHPQTTSLLPRPQLTQLSNCVYRTLQLPQLTHKSLPLQTITTNHSTQQLLVLLHECYYALPEVFGNVFGLVPRFVDHLGPPPPPNCCLLPFLYLLRMGLF